MVQAAAITLSLDGRQERFSSFRDAAESLRPLALRLRQDSRQRRDSRLKLGHAANQLLEQAPYGQNDRWQRMIAAACEMNLHTLRKAMAIAAKFADENGEFDRVKYETSTRQNPNRNRKALTRTCQSYSDQPNETPNETSKLLTPRCQNYSGEPNNEPSTIDLEEAAGVRTPRVYIDPELPECGEPTGSGVAVDDEAEDRGEEPERPDVTVVHSADTVAIGATLPKARTRDVRGQAFLTTLYEQYERIEGLMARVRGALDAGSVPGDLGAVLEGMERELVQVLGTPRLSLT